VLTVEVKWHQGNPIDPDPRTVISGNRRHDAGWPGRHLLAVTVSPRGWRRVLDSVGQRRGSDSEERPGSGRLRGIYTNVISEKDHILITATNTRKRAYQR